MWPHGRAPPSSKSRRSPSPGGVRRTCCLSGTARSAATARLFATRTRAPCTASHERRRHTFQRASSRRAHRAAGSAAARRSPCSPRCAQTAASRRRRRRRRSPSAEVVDRDVTEWDEFTGRLEAVDSVDVRPRVSGLRLRRALRRRRHRAAAATCCSRSIRGRSRPKSIGCAPSCTRAGATVAARRSELRARRAAARRERDVAARSSIAAPPSRRRPTAQVAAVEAALAPPSSTSSSRASPRRSTAASAARSSPRATWSRAGRAKRRCSPRSCRSIRSTRTSTPTSRSFLSYQRAGAAARRDARGRRRRSGWRSPTRRASRTRARCDFLDNQLDPRPARSAAARCSTTPTAAHAGPVRAPAAAGQRRRIAAVLIQDRAVGTDLDKRFVFVVDAERDDRVPRR